METENKLSDIPHEMLTQALADLEKIERDPHYSINMRAWHNYIEQIKKCEVCLAGAAMACTYGIPRHTIATPYQRRLQDSVDPFRIREDVPWSLFDSRKLLALDYFRVGRIEDGLVSLTAGAPEYLRERYHAMRLLADDLGHTEVEVIAYRDSPKRFKQNMFLIAGYLHLLWTKTA